MSNRDKKALVYLVVAAMVALGIYFWPESGAPAKVVGMYQSIPQAEQRLEKLRRRAALVPAEASSEKRVSAVLAEREKALLSAETSAQAQALLLQIVRRACDAQSPAIVIRGSNFGRPRAANDYYGEIGVNLTFEVRIEQLVNLLADLAARPELIAVDQLSIGQANDKQKTIPVQMDVTALVPKHLVPEEKKGLARF